MGKPVADANGPTMAMKKTNNKKAGKNTPAKQKKKAKAPVAQPAKVAEQNAVKPQPLQQQHDAKHKSSADSDSKGTEKISKDSSKKKGKDKTKKPDLGAQKSEGGKTSVQPNAVTKDTANDPKQTKKDMKTTKKGQNMDKTKKEKKNEKLKEENDAPNNQGDQESASSDAGNSNKKKKKKKRASRRSSKQGAADATVSQLESVKTLLTKFKGVKLPEPSLRNTQLVEGGVSWTDVLEEAKPTKATVSLTQTAKGNVIVPPTIVEEFRGYGRALLDNEADNYESRVSKARGNDQSWLKNILRSGTLGDKHAALVMRVQHSPLHRLNALQNLLGSVTKKSKRENVMALDSLHEVFSSRLLPARKLVPLAHRPLLQLLEDGFASDKAKSKNLDRVIMMWVYEDTVKKGYGAFVETLTRLVQDPEVNIKSKVLTIAYNLLTTFPEHEQALLSLLVSTLGDPAKRVASRTIFYLQTLLREHPPMTMVVIKEVQQLLFRPNIKLRAQYYAITFLTQIELSHRMSDVAAKLVELYFNFFKGVIKPDQEEHYRLLSAVLTGINRANPYRGDASDDMFNTYANDLFRITHVGSFNCSVQALMLLFQVMDSSQTISDRFYRALYSSLYDPRLPSTSKHGMYLSLLHKAIVADPQLNRVRAFCKRLLQVCMQSAPNFTCAALIVLSKVLHARPALRAMFEPEAGDEEEIFVDMPEKEDEENGAEKDNDADESHGGGAHGVKKEEEVVEPGKNDGDEAGVLDSVKEEEDGDGDGDDADGPRLEDAQKGSANNDRAEGGIRYPSGYEPLKREPLFARADTTAFWEVALLQQHFHPTVKAFIKAVLSGELVTYQSDALQDFSLTRFLDRFMFKNPKQKQKRTDSIMQPKEVSKRALAVPVNSKQFVEQDEEQVAPDEVFFLKYFRLRNKLLKPTKKREPASIDAAIGREEVDGDAIKGLNFDFATAMGRGEKYEADSELEELLADEPDYDSFPDTADEEEAGEEEQGKARERADEAEEGEKEEEKELKEGDDSEPARKRAKKLRKKKTKKADEASGQESEEDSDVENFDYDKLDLDALDEDDTDLRAGEDMDEATLERMLIEESDSDEEEEEKGGKGGRGASLDEDIDSSVFAAADDFAQLLEEAEEGGAEFERKRAKLLEATGRGRSGRGRGRGRGGRGRGRGGRGSSRGKGSRGGKPKRR